MKATICGQDYIIILEKETREFDLLKEGIKLESILVDSKTHSTLNKKVTLKKCTNTDNHDGIDLKYFPKRRKGWVDIKKVQIRVSPFALEQIKSRRRFGTRYDGSNMIEIYERLPPR